MRYHLYASRPIPADGGWPPTVGYPTLERDLGTQRDYLFLCAEDGTERAVRSLLFHAERRTVNWVSGGWADSAPADTIIYELGRARRRARRPLARITPDDRFTAAYTLAELLPGRALDLAVINFTNDATGRGHTPTRVPTLTRLIHADKTLPPVAPPQGATA